MYLVPVNTRLSSDVITSRLFDLVGRLHDVEAYLIDQLNTIIRFYLFTTHWIHLSIIFIWISGTVYHIGWTGDFSYWCINPISLISVAHSLWDPHIIIDYTSTSSSVLAMTVSYSGVSHYLYCIGFRQE